MDQTRTSTTSLTPLRTLLHNYYGVTGPVPNSFPQVFGRVSPEDHAYLKTLFPTFAGKFDIIISTLYARFIDELRTRLSALPDPPADFSVHDVDDPRWAVFFDTLYSVLPGCPTRRDFLLTKAEEAGRNDSSGVDRLCETLSDLASILADTTGGTPQGSGGVPEEEKPSGAGGGVTEGVAGVDGETNALFKLLRS